MSQNNVDFTSNPTGTELMDDLLLPEQQNFLTCNSGISRPSYAVKGTVWLDISVTPHLLKQYDGSSDVTLGSINPTTHAFVPTGVDSKQDILTFDNDPTLNSTNPVKSGGVYNALLGKQDTSNLVTSLSSSSTDAKYPSAKCVYDAIDTLNGLTKVPLSSQSYSSTINLATNTIYTLTLTGDVTFVLPTPTTGKFNQIEVQLYMGTVYNIDFGTSYYFNKDAPDVSESGYYSIIYEYDWLQSNWIVGAIKKGLSS